MSKVWFITGAARGLGRAFTEAALARGDRVAATTRNPQRLTDLVSAYADAILPLALDVNDEDAVAAGVRGAHEHFGRLDVIVNNAGYGLFGAVEELPDELLRRQLETNLLGPLRVVRAALPYLREQGGGRILQISSVGGVTAMPLGGGYNASKWALEGLSESLAQEVAQFGIAVTIVEPGSYATDAIPEAVQAAPLPHYDALRQGFGALASSIQHGDPAAAGRTLLAIADADPAPLRAFLDGQGFPIVQPAYADRLQVWADWEKTRQHSEPNQPEPDQSQLDQSQLDQSQLDLS
ncbi:SDR family NAD(P)-dependent oxidoreductase [Hamadaea tsunoensis]|uniref:SDR family NAD(P)-dependent oxidoreductase n=1 Tax=Hamadaea tsunoensis TaxID=53368 RepID=UPI000428AB5C|nr:SDR family NAD(P)-dependent oxidoreductase [Hamadaea tsunoensis]